MKIVFIIFLILNFLCMLQTQKLVKRLEGDWLEYLECNDLPAKINHKKGGKIK